MTFTLPSLRHSGWNLVLALIAMALGAAIAVPVARFVKMTAMPQLVAIFNGVGGGAAALISIVELLHLHSLGLQPAVYVTAEVLLGVLIGSVSFSGSAIAFIKLQELITGRPITYPGQQVINALVGAAIGVMVILALVTGSIVYVWVILVLALVLGRDLRAAHRRRRRAGADFAARTRSPAWPWPPRASCSTATC